MTVVTTGVVSIEDGKKSATEFEPARKVRVELTFTVNEGEDIEVLLDQVSDLANQKVQVLLSGTKGEAAPKPVRKKAADKPPPIQVVLPPDPPAKAVVADDPAGMGDFDAPAEATTPITDKELHDAARKKADELGAPVKIRQLVGTFANGQAGFQLIQVPQERRREFLTKLKALTA